MDRCRIAKIALAAATYAIDKPYDYLIPPEWEHQVARGMRVMVPFGAGNRRSEGFVLAVTQGERTAKLKTIVSLLDESPVLDGDSVKLALWMRDRFFCTVYDAARAMLPAGLWFALRDSYKIVPGIDRESSYQAAGRSEAAQKLLELIWASGGAAEILRIREAFGEKDPNSALKQLMDAGVLTMETSASRGVGDKTEQVAQLAIPSEEALALVTPKRKSAPLRYGVVELLCGIGCASTKEICYFTGASSATLRSLAKSGILTLEKREVLRRVSIEGIEPVGPPVLNGEQQNAFTALKGLCERDEPSAALLYGVTGSGKTQVYIQLIHAVLEQGRTAMVLVPEIALTPQLLRIFASHFGDAIAVLHSSLRAGERYDEWKRIRSGEAKVVLGTRSAVFAPLTNLGIIILDEEQETTYKSENTPRYHARDVAKYRCAKSGALLLLGSATPSVETMYLAQTGVYHFMTLARRYNEHALPNVYISDMKAELKNGNGTSISTLLRRELAFNLERGEQSILFLNRRGASRMVSCGECGEVPTCPRCSVHLTYHSANERLMCHYCGHSERLPDACPQCGGQLQFIGTGTQRVQEELQALFPGIEVLRMDTDTVTATQTHETLLSKFEKEKIPILIGTQMVAKGLDFENVTLVGVIAADLALYVDSFRASERTFSLLTQVVGRAGRGEKKGRAVIQTYTPDNEVIRYAAAQDYSGFYEQEIGLRRLMASPPFSDLFILTASGINEAAVLRSCMRLRSSLDSWLTRAPYAALEAKLFGPAPAAVAKVNNRYRYRLTLSCKNTKEIRALLSHLLCAAHGDRENRGVSVFVDVNPYD
ncbi:MAG: primosomal protein N' [Clostridia bacterium]|nr:primosomal protein N' [Clostridia bacterium]